MTKRYISVEGLLRTNVIEVWLKQTKMIRNHRWGTKERIEYQG